MSLMSESFKTFGPPRFSQSVLQLRVLLDSFPTEGEGSIEALLKHASEIPQNLPLVYQTSSDARAVGLFHCLSDFRQAREEADGICECFGLVSSDLFRSVDCDSTLSDALNLVATFASAQALHRPLSKTETRVGLCRGQLKEFADFSVVVAPLLLSALAKAAEE